MADKMEALGFDVRKPRYACEPSVLFSKRAAHLLTYSRALIVGLVDGNLEDACLGLLLSCDIVIAEPRHTLCISSRRFLDDLVSANATHDEMQLLLGDLAVGRIVGASDATLAGLITCVVFRPSELDTAEKITKQFLTAPIPPCADAKFFLRRIISQSLARMLPGCHCFEEVAAQGRSMTAGALNTNDIGDAQHMEGIAKPGESSPLITLIIQNLPCSSTSRTIAETIDAVGFRGRFAFVYVPSAGSRYRQVKSTLGYGFIGFRTSADAAAFERAFQGFEFRSQNRTCLVSFSKQQGKQRIEKILKRAWATRMDPTHVPVIHDEELAGIISNKDR